MTDNVIDAVIASENERIATEAPVTEPAAKEPEKVEPEVTEETDKTEPTEENGEEHVVFPKKAVNAISRRDKIIAKERATRAALEAEIAQLRQLQAQPQKQPVQSDAPTEEQFETYGEYLEAKVLHKIKLEQEAQGKAQQEQAVTAKVQEWAAQREGDIYQKAQSYAGEIPDFSSVMTEYADVADMLPEHVVNAFYEADDAALAFYNLAKEGKLESLMNMSPARAAMEIGLAQQKRPSINRVSNAPEPMKAATGTAKTAKRFEDLDGAEMIKKLGLT